MKKTAIILIILWVGILQSQSISEFNVAIFPDYFDNNVTIEYSGSVNMDNLPVNIGFLVPSEADSILQISVSETEKITRIRPEVIEGESWVFLAVEEEQFRLFVFTPPFDNRVGQRNYNFTFKSNQELSDAHIVVQEPINAEDFTLSKPGSEPFSDQHGLNFHRYHIDNHLANTKIDIGFQYVNPTGLTTLQALQTMLSEGGSAQTPIPSNRESQRSLSSVPERYNVPYWQPFTVLLILAVVIAIIVNKSEIAVKSGKSDNRFCTNCGKQINKSDKFCAHCGQKMK